MESNGFLTAILGDMTFVEFLVYLMFGVYGMLINVLADIIKRKSTSTTSPQKFSFRYYWMDNKYRIWISLLMIPVAILTINSLIGVSISTFMALCIGFGADYLIEILKKKNIVTNESTRLPKI